MTYARRPMGDYKTYGYAGDPGFLSGLWKGIKKVARIAAPFIPGIGGIVAGAVVGQGGGGGGALMKPSPGIYGGALTFPGGTGLQLGYQPGQVQLGGQRVPPYTASGPGVLPYGGRGQPGMPSGYHYAKDGSGRFVRNRRMNVANPKALRRAMRRAQGFEKLARRSINFNKRVRPARKRSS